MKTRTSFAAGNPGRKPGSKGRIRREVRELMRRLERSDTLRPQVWFERLQAIALGDDVPAAVSASRVLLEYRFGRPVSALEVEMQHELGPSIVEMLERIGKSDSHRQRLEERERKRLAPVIEITTEETQS